MTEHLTRLAKHVILIIIDDVRSDQFFEYYNSGKMPNLKKLGDNGISCDKCVTTFPSITVPTQPNIMTGAYSGYYPISGSGIPMYHWVDRESNPPKYHLYSGLYSMNQKDDIGPNVKTIFEQIGEGNSYSVIQFCSRGVTKVFPDSFFTGLIFYLYYIILKKPESGHPAITKRLLEAFKNPKKIFKNNNKPIAATAYYLATDALMHEFGNDSDRYIKALLDFDEEIGKIITELEELGILDDTVIAITSDHGNYKGKKAKDLAPFLESKGLVPFSNKTGDGDFDLNFGSLGFFNFRGETWKKHPTIAELTNFKPTNANEPINLIDMMFEIEGVKFVYFREDGNTPEKGKIRILKKDDQNHIHKAAIEYEDDKTRYTFGDLDVFGYSDDVIASKMLDKNFHTIDEWLEHTYHVDYPMVVDQVVRYFKNPRSCDILVSTCTDVCYNYEHGRTQNTHIYSHDVGLKSSMHVPLVIGGSRIIPKMKLDYCKTTDIVPTLLEFLGKTPDKSVVGTSLLNWIK